MAVCLLKSHAVVSEDCIDVVKWFIATSVDAWDARLDVLASCFVSISAQVSYLPPRHTPIEGPCLNLPLSSTQTDYFIVSPLSTDSFA